VTDAGGTVSHPAVLSREFGIPAVVGTSVATQQISNGDRIRLNGTTVSSRSWRRRKPRRTTSSGSEVKSMRRAPMINSATF